MKSIEFELSDIYKDIEQHMIDCGRVFAKTKLNNITSGNESVVLNDGTKGTDELEMYITRSGSKLGHLDEPIAIVKTLLGEYDGNMLLASSEADIHKEIHRRRLQENPELKSSACAHAHTLSAVALSTQFEAAGTREIEIPRKYRTARLGETVPVFTSQYGSGAKDMVKNIPGILVDHPGLVLGNHGAFAVGENLEETLRFLMDLESASERMISDLTIPRKLQKIESMVPNDWFKKYSVAGLFDFESYEGGKIVPKTIGELEEESSNTMNEQGLARKRYLDEISAEFKRTGQDLTDFSMDPFKKGSLSRRIGETIYITRAGVDFSDLGKDDILTFRMGEGNSIRLGFCEGWLHETIYDEIATNYIAHLLPEYSTRYSVYCGNYIIPIDVEGQYMTKKIPVADPGDGVLSKENVDAVINGLRSNEKVTYIKGLGGIALGSGGLYEPLHFLESAESSVKIIILAKGIGVNVREKQKKFESW